jgi:hypothetical protein
MIPSSLIQSDYERGGTAAALFRIWHAKSLFSVGMIQHGRDRHRHPAVPEKL